MSEVNILPHDGIVPPIVVLGDPPEADPRFPTLLRLFISDWLCETA